MACISIGNLIGRYVIEVYDATPPVVTDELLITFADISAVEAIMVAGGGSITNVADWNTAFTTFGGVSNFTSVVITDDTVNLKGGSDVYLPSLFYGPPEGLEAFIATSIIDTLGAVIRLDLELSTVTETPDVSGLIGLTFLSFAGLPISDTPDLTGLTVLEHLNLADTALDLTDIDAVLTFYGTLRENITEVYLTQTPPIVPTALTLEAAQTANPQCTFYVDEA